jgi:hypothetical protein
LFFWPYARSCGAGLYGYLGAECAVVIGGIWVTTYSWRRRAGRAHAAAFVMVLVGTALISLDVLPRVGYAKQNPLTPEGWECVASAPVVAAPSAP